MFMVFGRTGPPTLRGPPFWTPKIPYKLTFILPLIAMLTKEPEMLQPDAFCEHTIQQNATAAGDPRLQRSPNPLAGFKRPLLSVLGRCFLLASRLQRRFNNNNNNNNNDNVYGAVIVAQSHCESSPSSYDEYGTTPSGRRPSDEAKRPGL